MTGRSASTVTVSWVRVRLAQKDAASAAPTEGELILRADRAAVDGEHMLFLVGDEEVFSLDRRFYRSHAWFVDRPTFAEWLRERRTAHANHGRAWSGQEDERLRAAITGGLDWSAISAGHGRSVTALRRRAARLAAGAQKGDR